MIGAPVNDDSRGSPHILPRLPHHTWSQFDRGRTGPLKFYARQDRQSQPPLKRLSIPCELLVTSACGRATLHAVRPSRPGLPTESGEGGGTGTGDGDVTSSFLHTLHARRTSSPKTEGDQEGDTHALLSWPLLSGWKASQDRALRGERALGSPLPVLAQVKLAIKSSERGTRALLSWPLLSGWKALQDRALHGKRARGGPQDFLFLAQDTWTFK